MRRNIAAGNWKMNLTSEKASELASEINKLNIDDNVDVILGSPSVFLANVAEITKNHPRINAAAQNCHQAEKGAFTGEISIQMLKSIGVGYVIVGHSERREIFNESNQIIKEKIDALLQNEMIPIFCCGEPLEIREKGDQNVFVKNQFESSIFHLHEDEIQKLIIAYEPIWAIGTGKTASPEQAQNMHAFLRKLIAEKYNNEIADNISILYGGSVKPANAKELFSQPDVDGGLVGGASLTLENFGPIISAF